MHHVPVNHLSFTEAIVVGLIQGVTELFPVSSLGHNVLIPALVGGQWAHDLNVARKESDYLAFIVGLHVATAIGITFYFWRDWVRILRGFFTSFRPDLRRPVRVENADQKLAWMIVLATIPVGVVGLAFEHTFRVLFGIPVLAAVFLVVNGVILYIGERFRPKRSREADEVVLREMEREPELVGAGVGRAGGVHSSGQRAIRSREIATAVQADRRITSHSFVQAVIIGSAQCIALFAGISRDGVTMCTGMFRGLSR
ncbi:MAG TPA: undecaprenyl-diphosphate phosphatase, partial [Streptosporangiaceae bacterium]